jgi:hypothetical protein
MENHNGLYINYIEHANKYCVVACDIIISEAVTVHVTQILPRTAGMLNDQLPLRFHVSPQDNVQ